MTASKLFSFKLVLELSEEEYDLLPTSYQVIADLVESRERREALAKLLSVLEEAYRR